VGGERRPLKFGKRRASIPSKHVHYPTAPMANRSNKSEEEEVIKGLRRSTGSGPKKKKKSRRGKSADEAVSYQENGGNSPEKREENPLLGPGGFLLTRGEKRRASLPPKVELCNFSNREAGDRNMREKKHLRRRREERRNRKLSGRPVGKKKSVP